MLQRAKTRLFPLHLAPIDDFFCADDRPSHPMAFTCQLFFSGVLRRGAFEAALAEALGRHPLLRALIRPAKAGKPCWVSAGELMPFVQWGEMGESCQFETTESIDLAQEVGLRIWVRTSSTTSEVLLQFHHACCDGTGAYRFIGDLLAEYGLRTGSEDELPVSELPVLEFCDQRLLKERRTKMGGTVVRGTRIGVTIRGIRHALEVFSRKIAPLSVPRRLQSRLRNQPDFHAHLYPGIVTHVFDKSQYKSLRDAAGRAGAMFNDLLMSEMFLTMRDWNERHGNGRRQWLRIMMPTDLREKEDLLMPAANMTGYSFVTRSTSECDDPVTLLRSVRDETLQIKRDKSGKRFIEAVMASRNVPGLLNFLLNRNRCLATVILSNVGDPSRRFLSRFPRDGGKVRCGNVRLERIAGVPPLRHLSRATVSVVTYGRQFAIHVRCDPKSMTPEDAREFLDLFASRLSGHLPPVEVESVMAEPEVAAAV